MLMVSRRTGPDRSPTRWLRCLSCVGLDYPRKATTTGACEPLGPVLKTAGNLLNATSEPNALLRAVRATVAPRLVQEDARPFDELLRAAFREDALVQDDGSTQQEGTDALIDAISVDRLDKAFTEAAQARK